MKSLRFRRDRRNLTLLASVGIAIFLGFGAVAYACVGGGMGTTSVAETTSEPGGTITASGSGLTPSTAYVLILNDNAANCHHGTLALGGSVTSTSGGTIPPTQRVIPTNTANGVKYLCWQNPDDPDDAADPDSVSLF